MAVCKQCSQVFEITTEDRRFYDRISPIFGGKKYLIPEPTLCPDCRYQRRLIWRPELHLFKRKSDFSGETMLSMYPPEAKSKVYSHPEWWSDKWDATDQGRDFDFSRPFFEQFGELILATPGVALFVGGNENSDYIKAFVLKKEMGETENGRKALQKIANLSEFYKQIGLDEKLLGDGK